MLAKQVRKSLALLLALVLMMGTFPVSALAEGGLPSGASDPVGKSGILPLGISSVARIGGVEYDTLDEAVTEAQEGDTIELLADCTLETGFNKTLTFTGNGKITIDKQLKTNGEGWMCFGLYDSTRVLTFDGPGVSVEWNSDGTSPWLMLSLSGTLNVINGASLTFQFDSRTTNARNAIYMNSGAVLNVTNGSTFRILGIDTKGTAGQGIQLDKAGTASINVTGGSTFLIDGTNRGYVNSPSIYVEDSAFTVQNCTANASNGGNFQAVNSEVTYQNNAGHGLSAGNVILENSTLTSHHNGLYGVYVNGDFQVDSTSRLIVTENSYDGDCSGLNLTANVKEGFVESGAVVTITGNKCSGLSNRGVCTFEEGVQLTITDNYNDKGSVSHGGGIYNTKDTANLTLPSDAVIYNNHAVTSGDDIYNTGTITFGSVGSNWVLSDCGDLIDGWYLDGADARWNAHGDPINVVEFSGGKTVKGNLALKAAHPVDAQVPENPELPQWERPENKKTATNLVKKDGNYESQVTLSIPGDGVPQKIEVVFVADATAPERWTTYRTQIQWVLEDLADLEQAGNVKAYTSLVTFGNTASNRGMSAPVPVQEFLDGNQLPSFIYAASGTNIQAGVQMGRQVLAAGSPDAEKYLVLLTDGGAFYWQNEEGQSVTKPYKSGDNGNFYNNTAQEDSHIFNNNLNGLYSIAAGSFANFRQQYQKDLEAFNLGAVSCQKYDSEDQFAGRYIYQPGDWSDKTKYPFTNMEQALYNASQEMLEAAASGIHLITVGAYDYYPEQKAVHAMSNLFLDWTGEVGALCKVNTGNPMDDVIGAFWDLEDEMLGLLDRGSVVLDVIGYGVDNQGNDYDFDFVNDIDHLTLTVGGVALDKTQLDEYTYGFGSYPAPREYDPDQDPNRYQFMLRYYPDGYAGSTECFVWNIDTPVSKYLPVELTYTVRLTNPQTAPGTYGAYDADGSKGYDGLYTNKEAVLYPVSPTGEALEPEIFSKPTVSYTVEKPDPVYHTVTVHYLEEGTNQKLNPSYTERLEAGSVYDVTDRNAIAIANYTYLRTDGDDLSGTLDQNKVINVWYKAKTPEVETYTVTINYYNSRGMSIRDSVRLELAAGEMYDVTSYRINMIRSYYFNYATGDAMTGMLDGDKVINLWYRYDRDDDDNIVVDDPDVPMGSDPDGDDSFTIVDPNLPLGNLPTTGSSAALALAAGTMAAAGAYLLLKKKNR